MSHHNERVTRERHLSSIFSVPLGRVTPKQMLTSVKSLNNKQNSLGEKTSGRFKEQIIVQCVTSRFASVLNSRVQMILKPQPKPKNFKLFFKKFFLINH